MDWSRRTLPGRDGGEKVFGNPNAISIPNTHTHTHTRNAPVPLQPGVLGSPRMIKDCGTKTHTQCGSTTGREICGGEGIRYTDKV